MASLPFKARDAAQRQRITTSLRNLLRDYPLESFPKEMIQNADDAGATEVRFILDWRHGGHESLLFPETYHWQGPCLWVYNDALFKDTDWDGIQRLGEGSAKTRSIGRFGVGFNSVYNITDLPSVLSGSALWLSDPHERYLQNPAEPELGNRAGQLLQFGDAKNAEQWESFLQKYHGQFDVYHGVQGCDLRSQYFKGTLLRLPLRTSSTPASEIKPLGGQADMNRLSETFLDDSHLLLLFLRNVRRVAFMEIKDTISPCKDLGLPWSELWDSPGVNMIMSVSLEPHKELGDHGQLVEINTQRSPASIEKHLYCRCWPAPASGAWRSPGLAATLSCNDGCYSLSAGSDVCEPGRAFCFLPLPKSAVTFGLIGVHVHAPFLVSQDRRSLRSDDDELEDPGTGQQTTARKLNEALLGDRIPLMLVNLVDLLLPLLHDPSSVFLIFPKLPCSGADEAFKWTAGQVAENFYVQLLAKPRKLPTLGCAAPQLVEWTGATTFLDITNLGLLPQNSQLQVAHLCVEYGAHVVDTRGAPHIIQGIETMSSKSHTICRLTPAWLRQWLRSQHLEPRKASDAVAFLEFASFEVSDFDELRDLKLLVNADGQVLPLENVWNGNHYVYVEFTHGEAIGGSWGKKSLIDPTYLENEKVKGVVVALAEQNQYQLRQLSVAMLRLELNHFYEDDGCKRRYDALTEADALWIQPLENESAWAESWSTALVGFLIQKAESRGDVMKFQGSAVLSLSDGQDGCMTFHRILDQSPFFFVPVEADTRLRNTLLKHFGKYAIDASMAMSPAAKLSLTLCRTHELVRPSTVLGFLGALASLQKAQFDKVLQYMRKQMTREDSRTLVHFILAEISLLTNHDKEKDILHHLPLFQSVCSMYSCQVSKPVAWISVSELKGQTRQQRAEVWPADDEFTDVLTLILKAGIDLPTLIGGCALDFDPPSRIETAAGCTTIVVGSHVQVHGLKNEQAQRYNGCKATVIASGESSMWTVQLQGSEKVLNVKEANLEFVAMPQTGCLNQLTSKRGSTSQEHEQILLQLGLRRARFGDLLQQYVLHSSQFLNSHQCIDIGFALLQKNCWNLLLAKDERCCNELLRVKMVEAEDGSIVEACSLLDPDNKSFHRIYSDMPGRKFPSARFRPLLQQLKILRTTLNKAELLDRLTWLQGRSKHCPAEEVEVLQTVAVELRDSLLQLAPEIVQWSAEDHSLHTKLNGPWLMPASRPEKDWPADMPWGGDSQESILYCGEDMWPFSKRYAIGAIRPTLCIEMGSAADDAGQPDWFKLCGVNTADVPEFDLLTQLEALEKFADEPQRHDGGCDKMSFLRTCLFEHVYPALHHTNLHRLWIPLAASFEDVSKLALPAESDSKDAAPSCSVNIPPFLFCVPTELRKLPVVKHSVPNAEFSIEVCVQALQTMRGRVLNPNELGIALQLCKLCARSRDACQQEGLLVPTQRGELAPPSDCVYNNQPHLPLHDAYLCHGRPLVHQFLMQDEENLPKVLGVVPRTVLECHACVDASWVEDADAGQREDLTTRIHNILQQYPEGTTIMKELLQNADDAGGTRISFMFDWNPRLQNRKSCLTPELAELNGPCLWVYSDEKFRQDDWASLKKLGVGGKREKPNMIGHFGLGFNSVYNFTDVPMILSADKLLILDPHKRFLEGFVGSDRSGGCLLNWLPLLETFPDQLAPFHGIQGCQARPCNAVPFEGTLMRLPFRSDQSLWTSQISPVVMSEARADRVIRCLHEEAPQWLLFLNNITCIEVGLIPKSPALQLASDSRSEVSLPKKHVHHTSSNSNCFLEEPAAHTNCVFASSALDVAGEHLQSSGFECLLRCSKADNQRETQEKAWSKELCFTQTVDIRCGRSRCDRFTPIADWNTPHDGWKGRLIDLKSLQLNVDSIGCGFSDPSQHSTVLLLPVEADQLAGDVLKESHGLSPSAVVIFSRKAAWCEDGRRQYAAGDRPQQASNLLELELDHAHVPVVQIQSTSGEQLEKQLAFGASITATFSSHDNFASFECLKKAVKDSLAQHSNTRADSKIVVVSREFHDVSLPSLEKMSRLNSLAPALGDDFTWLIASSSSCEDDKTLTNCHTSESALVLEQRAVPMEHSGIGDTTCRRRPHAAIALLLDVTSATQGSTVLREETVMHERMSGKGLHTWCCYLPLDIRSEERMRFVVHANFALEQNRLGMVSKLHHESEVKRQEAEWNRDLFCGWVHPLLCSCLHALGHPNIRNSTLAFNARPTDFLPTEKHIPIEIREVFCLNELYKSLAVVPLFPQAALNSHEMQLVSYSGSCEPFDAVGKLTKVEAALSQKHFIWAEFNQFVQIHFYPVCHVDNSLTKIWKEAEVERPRPSALEVAEKLRSSPDLSTQHAVHALRFVCNEAKRSPASKGSDEEMAKESLVDLIMGTRVAVDVSESSDTSCLELRSLGSCDLYWPTPSRCSTSHGFAIFLEQFRHSADKLVQDSSRFSSWVKQYEPTCLRCVSVDVAPEHEIYCCLKTLLIQNPEAAAPLRVTLLDKPTHVAAAMRCVQGDLDPEKNFWQLHEIMGGLRRSAAGSVVGSSVTEPTSTSVNAFLPLWRTLGLHIGTQTKESAMEEVKLFNGLPFIPSGNNVFALKGDRPLLLQSQAETPYEQDKSFEIILSKLGVHMQHMPESRICRQVLSALQDAGYVQNVNLSSVLRLLPVIEDVESRAEYLTCDEKKEFLHVMLQRIEEFHRHYPGSMSDVAARGILKFMSLPVWRPHSGRSYKKLSDLQLVRMPTLAEETSLSQAHEFVKGLHKRVDLDPWDGFIFLYSGSSQSYSCMLDGQDQVDLVLSSVGESDDTGTIQVVTNLPIEHGGEIPVGAVISRIAAKENEQIFWAPESKDQLSEYRHMSPNWQVTFRSHPHYEMQALNSLLEIKQVREHLGARLLNFPRHMLYHVLPKLSERYVSRSVALDMVSQFLQTWDSQDLPVSSSSFPVCVPDRLNGSNKLHRAHDLYDPQDDLVESLCTACPSLAKEFERRLPHASLCGEDVLTKLRTLGLRRFSNNSQPPRANTVKGLLDCARLFELHLGRIHLKDRMPGVGVVSRSQVLQDKLWELLRSLCGCMQREQLIEFSSLKIFWCPQLVHHSIICSHSKDLLKHTWCPLSDTFPQDEAAFVWSIRPVFPYSGDYGPPAQILELMQSVRASNDLINLEVIQHHLTKLSEISQQAFAVDPRHATELQRDSRLLVEALGRHMAKARTSGRFVEIQAELKNKQFITAQAFSSNHMVQQVNTYELLPPKIFSVALQENTGSRRAVPDYLREIDGFVKLLEDLGAGSGLDVSVEPPGVTTKFFAGLGPIGNKLSDDPHHQRHRQALEATSDVILVSRDNRRFPAQKVILALHNEYFHKMFCEPFSEAVTGARPEIKIQEASGHALCFFLTALYENEFPRLLEVVGSPEDRELVVAAREIFEFADMMCDSSMIAAAQKEISEALMPEFYYDTLRFLSPYDRHGQDLRHFILRQMASFRFDEAVQEQIQRLRNDEAMHALSLQLADMLREGAEEVE